MFSVYAELCYHHCYLNLEHFYHSQNETIYQSAITLQHPSAQETTNLISISIYTFAYSRHFISLHSYTYTFITFINYISYK